MNLHGSLVNLLWVIAAPCLILLQKIKNPLLFYDINVWFTPKTRFLLSSDEFNFNHIAWNIFLL